jgi:hypothetical protein
MMKLIVAFRNVTNEPPHVNAEKRISDIQPGARCSISLGPYAMLSVAKATAGMKN